MLGCYGDSLPPKGSKEFVEVVDVQGVLHCRGVGSLQSKEMFLSLCDYGKRFYRD